MSQASTAKKAVSSKALEQVRNRKASATASTSKKVDNVAEEKESALTGTYLVSEFMKAFGIDFIPKFRINVNNYPFVTFADTNDGNKSINVYLSVKASNSLREIDADGNPTDEFIYDHEETLNKKFFSENDFQIYQYTDETTGEDRFKVGMKGGEGGSTWLSADEMED